MSSNLLDIADRLSYNISRVRESASLGASRPVQGRFTTALLSGKDPSKPVTDFVRDALPGEPRLLSLDVSGRDDGDGRTTPTQKDVDGPGLGGGDLVGMAQLTRRQIISATPLRRKQEVGPGGEGGDIFLKSALKIIDRYQSMPRAKAHIKSLLERYNELVESTSTLKKQVQEIQGSIPANQRSRTDQFVSHKQVEQGVRDVEAKVAEARRKRDALKLRLHNLKNPGTAPPSDDPSISIDSSFTSSTMGTSSEGDTSSLNNEGMPSGLDFGNNSLYMSANRTPLVKKPTTKTDAAEAAFWGDDKRNKGEQSEELGDTVDEEDSEDDEVDDIDGQAEEQEETVVLSLAKPLPPRERSPEPFIPPANVTEKEAIESETRSQYSPEALAATALPPPTQSLPSARPVARSSQIIPENITAPSRSGPELDIIVNKIWKSVGDILLPGHSYDVGQGGERLPNSKDTIAILEELAMTSLPNAALTAQLLVAMLNSLSPSVPMQQIKMALEVLGNKRGFDRPIDLGTKALYACVAKKLLKIDRRTKEPTVVFDVS